MSPADRARPATSFVISHSHFGGAQELWANLVAAMRDRGYQSHLVALYPDEEGEQPTTADTPWNYVVPRRPSGPLEMAGMVRALARMLRAQSAGAVVTALPAANVAVPLAVSAGRLNSRVITTHHTPARTYSRGLDRADSLTGCLPCVRHIVTVSDGVAQSLAAKSAAYRAKLSTIRNAVPPDVERLLASLSADRRTRASRGKVLICSGRLAMQKNYPVVLRALARLPADVSLEIVGGGSDEQALRQLAAELAITDRVRFLGQMSRFDTLQRVSRADVFLQMSLFEGNSLSLIEAAKLGLPLIVSDVPEQREAITDPSGDLCGEAIGPHDHEGLAATVDRLLSDPNQLEQLERKSLALGDTIQFEKVVSAYERLLLPAG